MRRNAGAHSALPVLQNDVRTPVPLHVIEGVGYGAALHGWRLEYEDALPPCEWALAKARERGSNFHIVCLLFIRGLGLGNFGRLSDSLADLREGMRLSEINHERYWLPRLPNTLAWLHSEMFDVEEALRLNREGSIIAREMNFPEGDVNSQINLALNYLGLDEPNSAREHLARGRNVAGPGRVVSLGVYDSFPGRVCRVLVDEGRSSRSGPICNGVAQSRRRHTPAETHRVGEQAARRRGRDGGPTARGRCALSGGAFRVGTSPVSVRSVEDSGCPCSRAHQAPPAPRSRGVACSDTTCARRTRRLDQGGSSIQSVQRIASGARVRGWLIAPSPTRSSRPPGPARSLSIASRVISSERGRCCHSRPIQIGFRSCPPCSTMTTNAR